MLEQFSHSCGPDLGQISHNSEPDFHQASVWSTAKICLEHSKNPFGACRKSVWSTPETCLNRALIGASSYLRILQKHTYRQTPKVYAHIEIIVAFLVVNIFSFLIIAS